jgi:lysine-N-methylase
MGKMKEKGGEIMLLRYPAYFEDFRCIASQCPDSCCKEWEVLVDDHTAEQYLAMEDALGKDLRRYLYQDEEGDWYLRVTDGRCPMWREDGLCRIQADCGHDALCKTCREFPRLTHDYGDFVERGLELSCPEAARLIFENPNAPWAEKEIPGGEEPDYDPVDMEILLETRKIMLTILVDNSRSVQESLTLALLYGYHAQSLLDGGESAWNPEEALAFARSLAKPAQPAALGAFYLDLEILTDAWRQRLLSHEGETTWDERLRTLTQYGVQRYWLQAISDFDLVGRVKMVIAACLLVRYLGGDLVQTAQLYAKEIENNADNVDAILEGAYSSPALTDEKLLGMLLEV